MNDLLEQLERDIVTSGSNVRTIPLTRGKAAIVDAADYDRLACRKWHARKVGESFYAVRVEGRRSVYMHREIMNAPAGLLCDHKNHLTLDDRRCNLRPCTWAENARNRRPDRNGTSQYKGVCRLSAAGKWRAAICYEGRSIYIGCYEYEQDAAIAYDDMAIELFGEFAFLNFHYRPEIKDWLRRTYFFDKTRNNLGGDGKEFISKS
jgi:hypothetical protein